ncbi:MAG: polysaccharide deacetylase family protein [Paraglaciecola sp.]|uniref:polysaccharide deacetylase family protein n=1 Tax=Paraglaciecola sp. TaxID=1920173 RepID=UPI00273F15F0|nr:polysaccharide deacetylase family protein [Paraglaciecola sp.]MDP5030705.1 polysaccharide deacetylase family protein [Paraglaciecola sp.]MDP5133264.1 polysaccharide deacetylase family protein [Paraglaciecola sp.]
MIFTRLTTKVLLVNVTLLSFFACNLSAANSWPEGNKVAISLSYDDALNSQLDNALPALNSRGLKASFYVVPLSEAFKNRIDEWKALAQQGHELGNHTLFHSCIRSQPGRQWVDPANALEDKSVKAMINEISVANTLLTAMDGHSVHTLTPPCFDQQARDGNYIEAVKEQFIGIKSAEDPSFATLIGPSEISAEEIIAFIEKQPKNIKLINVLFHGIGGDHLVTTTEEHAKFLDYLAANKDKYWVDTYRNIMLAKNKHQG